MSRPDRINFFLQIKPYHSNYSHAYILEEKKNGLIILEFKTEVSENIQQDHAVSNV
jgi:hypothetical protein